MANTESFRCSLSVVAALLTALFISFGPACAAPHSLWIPTASRIDVNSLDEASVDALSAPLSSILTSLIASSGATLPSPSPGAPASSSTSKTTSRVDGDSYGGAGLTFPAAVLPALYTVILLHGSGATAQQMAPIVPSAQLSGLQRTKFILPQARLSSSSTGHSFRGSSSVFKLTNIQQKIVPCEKHSFTRRLRTPSSTIATASSLHGLTLQGPTRPSRSLMVRSSRPLAALIRSFRASTAAKSRPAIWLSSAFPRAAQSRPPCTCAPHTS
jgi:hypothetical protein